MSGDRLHLVWSVLVASATLVALAGCTGEAEGTDADFYAEVAVHVEPRDDDPLAHIDPDPGTSVVRWWYAAEPQRWRWEFEGIGPRLDAGMRVMVFDGDSSWGYDDRSRTYSRQDAMALPDGVVLSPSFSAPVGPANAADVDAFIEQWRERGGGVEVRRTGEDTVLGRAVEIVEIRPAWHSSSGSATAPNAGTPPSTPDTASTETSGGVVRVAIDPERMFVMRWAVDGEGGGQSYRAEIVALDYGASIDASRFVFDPPPDASEVPDEAGSCSSSSGSLGGPGVSVPPGFLVPAYVPAGFRSTGSGSEGGSGCALAATWVLLEADDGSYLLLRQRVRHALPESMLAWEPVTLDGGKGYRDATDRMERLAWQQGEVAILLESDVLSIEELARVANSMELGDRSPARLLREGDLDEVGPPTSTSATRGRSPSSVLAARAIHHGLDEIDAATLRLRAPRVFTQEVSRRVYEGRSERGEPFRGIRYRSRLGDQLVNWAVFEVPAGDPEPLTVTDVRTIDADEPDVLEAFALLGLHWA